VKTVAASLGVARSNIIERRDGHRPRRGPQERPGDVELAGEIRDLVDTAMALNLAPCFTPVESRESNGMAEAFVKTFKRGYVRVNPIPDAAAALARIDHWMEDYNIVHPHSRLGYRSPREYIALLS
jgi:integrase-like protein